MDRDEAVRLYRDASELVRVLNAAIDENRDNPERAELLKAALEHAHEGEDEIAKVVALLARRDGSGVAKS